MNRVLRLLSTALKNVFRERQRSLLSATSLVIGVVAVVLVQVAAAVASDWLLYQQEVGGARQGAATVTTQLSPGHLQVVINAAEADRDRLSARWDSSLRWQGITGTSDLTVYAYAGSLWVEKPFRLVSGDKSEGDVVNQRLAELIQSGAPQLLGDDQVNRPAPIISAVVDDASSTPASYLHYDPTRPIPTAPAAVTITYYEAGADNKAALERRLADLGLPNDGVVLSDPASEIARTAQMVNLGFTAAAVVTLLVGVLGVLNIGLATVKERSAELALRRCLGATSWEISLLVVFESAFIGVVGSLIALAIVGAAYVPVLSLLGIRATAFPVVGAVGGLIAGFGAGLLGGLTPARRAAKLELVDVMRA